MCLTPVSPLGNRRLLRQLVGPPEPCLCLAGLLTCTRCQANFICSVRCVVKAATSTLLAVSVAILFVSCLDTSLKLPPPEPDQFDVEAAQPGDVESVDETGAETDADTAPELVDPADMETTEDVLPLADSHDAAEVEAVDTCGQSCGNHLCQPECGEDEVTCESDCCQPASCGNGKCKTDTGPCPENGANCPQDCCVCGDSECDPLCGEEPSGASPCPADCS